MKTRTGPPLFPLMNTSSVTTESLTINTSTNTMHPFPRLPPNHDATELPTSYLVIYLMLMLMLMHELQPSEELSMSLLETLHPPPP